MTELENKNNNHSIGNLEDLIQLYLVAIDNQDKINIKLNVTQKNFNVYKIN